MAEILLPDKWLVVGPGSLVGSRFIELTKGSTLYGVGGDLDKDTPALESFRTLDITNGENVLEVISDFTGKYVINFAGATLVDAIEKTRPTDPDDQTQLDQNVAYRVNVLGTRNLIEACKAAGKFPIFISTGFVFDGTNGPYGEDDPVAKGPEDVSWYGWTKVLAEREVANSGTDSLTIRISYPYRTEYREKTDFARSFISLFDSVQKGEKDWYPIFTDQTLTPTFTDDIPDAVLTLVNANARGVYHVTSPQICTPYDFCCEVLKVARGVEYPEDIIPKGSLVDFLKKTKSAKKPIRGGEKTDKIVDLGFTPTGWKEGIRKAFGR